jgi:hypothetical protein
METGPQVSSSALGSLTARELPLLKIFVFMTICIYMEGYTVKRETEADDFPKRRRGKLLAGLGIGKVQGARTVSGSAPGLTTSSLSPLESAKGMNESCLKFLKPKGGPRLKVGDSFEINERRAVIMGGFPARRAFSGAPFIVTTFERATNYSLPQRRLVSFILAQADAGEDAAEVAKRIEMKTGLRAYTDEAFVNSTLLWWLKNTGVPGSFLTTVAFSQLFALTVNAFISSNFVSQHWKLFAALRAMGASGWQLIRMLLAQSLSMCLLCFCVGTLGAVLFGMAVKSRGLPPFLLTWEIILGVLVGQVIVGMVGPAMSVMKLHRLQPEEAFRN